MITRILLFGLVIAGLSSCATYRTGQTPDDVYYSPEREGASYVQTERDEDNRTSYNESNEDRRIRQQIRDQRFRSFDDDFYWNSPRYNSWGWNTWNNPYNTWGWNNNWGMNYGWGWNNRWNNSFYGGYNNFVCIPGSQSVIIIGGHGAPRNSTGIRYSPTIQRFNTTTTSNGKFVNTGGNGSRFFGGSNNNGGNRRSSFFGGGSNNNTYSGSSGSGSRTFGNSGSSSSGSRTFSGGSGNSGSSGSGSSRSTGSAGGRRN
jgi:hypothetical protein